MVLSYPDRRARAEGAAWQEALREAVRDLDELGRLLDIPRAALAAVAKPQRKFPLLVPRGFVARMQQRNLDDPLLKQVLTAAEEFDEAIGFGDDPLAEGTIARGGLLRKYRGRALLIASGSCPVHCRYCFRRAFPYQSQLAARGDFQAALATLSESPEIKEVILSGGDPLSLSNRKLARLFDALEDLPSVDTLRVHTRFPVMIPARVDGELLNMIARSSLNTVVVIHANHANELGAEEERALRELRESAGHLLNQSVLLRGINDDVDVLEGLSRRLFACGVLPYYLHLLDPVAGAAHFAVAEQRGTALMDELRGRLPGYLVPRLVREVPGELSKTPIESAPSSPAVT